MPRRLLFVVNVDWFFLSHRLAIAQAALKDGYEVHIATSITSRLSEMESHGLIVHPLSLKRGGVGILGSLSTLLEIFKITKLIQPDIVHLITIKPVVLGGIATRFARTPAVVAAVSGLGFVFIDSGFVAYLRRKVVSWMYRLALRHKNITVIFQNKDDRKNIVEITEISDEYVTEIRGSGVDLNRYHVSPYPTGTPKVILAARMLKDKGVREFVEAAKLLRTTQYAPKTGVRCILVGDPDPENQASLSLEQLSQWTAEGIVEVWGSRNDMPDVLASANVVVLPSYREGLPKVLIEAAACGRAVITTDVPGCRDAIEPNVTGLLVPVKQAEPLAQAIKTLLEDEARCIEMGNAGRLLAEQSFDINTVVSRHLDIYRRLLTRCPR